MDPKRQKMLLGVVAVLAIGAGSYYFLMGDDSGPQAGTRTGPVERRKVDKPAETKTERRKDPKKDKDEREASSAPVRKEREETEATTVERKKKRETKKEEKKKTVAPAA